MATIGTFSKTEDSFVGTIRTMTINVKAKIVPNKDKSKESAPDYRVYAGGAELGAGWMEEGKDGAKRYLALKLDDPSFAGPIRAAFFENAEEGTGVMVWSR
ncbi:DUF736 domain-containing protein [Hyphomonas sp. CY54-11-8]|uniref:DUF736 domain-containing protein n=1 Tax=Hyphomonas sp. CY54-11-8 TaxID=1280944 RepID=UPI000458BC88|nr:DUF736 domain-containing protein [Hyphomonas sp. CY54-11-8]KCZ48501.1 hypothetical protein HY17_16765 [Hyphomonas sp. CY54-11-8]